MKTKGDFDEGLIQDGVRVFIHPKETQLTLLGTEGLLLEYKSSSKFILINQTSKKINAGASNYISSNCTLSHFDMDFKFFKTNFGEQTEHLVYTLKGQQHHLILLPLFQGILTCQM